MEEITNNNLDNEVNENGSGYDSGSDSGSGSGGSDVDVVSISSEMRKSYLDYAMSVIVSRALPDVRDGLKPVQRRILYSMKESGLDYNKGFRKSAITVGNVIGRYHPHGDAAIYEAMVRMAQDFSMSETLIDGQGNFGSIDGDKAAAYRYTEARLKKISHWLLMDHEKDTVNFVPNFDNTRTEPSVLPARFPNILVNGAGGIAVGMATNIPPHNITEVINAVCAFIDNPHLTSLDLAQQYLTGPDFPTGAYILGRSGIMEMYTKGRGSIVMRAKTHIEEVKKDREAIIVTEIPYQVNKAKLVEKIAECVKSQLIEGIADLRDESNRQGIRIVIEVKKNFDPNVILNQLFKYTQLQTSFGANMLAIVNGRPQTLTLQDFIKEFVSFRKEVITRRTRFELHKAREKAHIWLGLAIAVANIDEMIELIKKSPSPTDAREELMGRGWRLGDVAPLLTLVEGEGDIKISPESVYTLSEKQANAILDLRLHKLTGLEREKISDELRDLVSKIAEYLEILNSEEKLFALMKQELIEVREEFGHERRSEILDIELSQDIESLIQKEDMVVTISHSGYIKRVPLSTYRAQNRGGKGRSGMSTKDDDFVSEVFVANTHTPLIFFSSKGMAYSLKVYKLPLGAPSSKGKPMINLLPLEKDETISTVLALPEDEKEWEGMDVMFATTAGTVRRNALSAFTDIRSNGKIAMKLEGSDEQLVSVAICTEQNSILLTSHKGQCIRFMADNVRRFNSRNSMGVRGIRLADDDYVISMSVLSPVDMSDQEARAAYISLSTKMRRGEDVENSELWNVISREKFAQMAEKEEFILSITDKGYGKRTSAYEYRMTARGGKGILNMSLTEKNGHVVASFPVKDNDQIMLVTDGGQMIRCPVKDIRIAGRNSMGVIVFRVKDDEKVVSVSKIQETTEEESSDHENNDGDAKSS